MLASLITPRSMNLLLLAAAAGALAMAFALEHLAGLRPCTLCIWQRWPYAVIIVAAGAGWALDRPRASLLVCLAALLVDAGIAVYHVGIEQGLIPLPDTCVVTGEATSIEDLRAQLMNARPTCDQVAFSFFGLSLSAMNGLFATGLAIVTAFALTRPDERLTATA